jgi:hypothetical protein
MIMKTPATILLLLAGLFSPLHSQTVLEWALSETGLTPDVDDTANLKGTLDIPILGDGVSSGITNSTALIGRFAPVTLANVDDSVTISYEVLIIGGLFSDGGTNADFRYGLFNSNGTTFGGDEASLSGWTGALTFNAGSGATDADILVRNIGNTERFYVSTGSTDISGGADYANKIFFPNGVIYTAAMTITRLAGDIMDISVTLTGDDEYSFVLSGQETSNAEFTFDRVGFWINVLDAELIAFKAGSAPASTDGDSIPDLEEVRWFGDLTTANDTTNSDGDAFTDLHEITVSFTDPTDGNDPPVPLTKLFIDFNADGTAGQVGPNIESGYLAYTAPHQTNTIDDPNGIDFNVFGSTVNFAVDYTDDSGFVDFSPNIKQMIGRGDGAALMYEGTMGELMRDWVGIDSRSAEGGNGPEGNAFGGPTNMTFTLTGLPAGDYQYRAYHHDAADIMGRFELTITDANRNAISLGNFQMTSSALTGGNPVYDRAGNTGTAGVDASTLSFAAGQEPPSGTESRTLLAANIGQAVVTDGILEVYLDDFPAAVSGSSNDRTWLQGIGYRPASGSEVTYVDVTLANTEIVGGGADSLWADGDDASTGGTITDGEAVSDGLWRFRSAQGNGGIWEATGGSGAVAEDCVEIVTKAAVPNDTYDVYVFYYPVSGTGDYPVRAGLTSAPQVPGANPGAGNAPSVLSSTVTVPFASDGSPVVFTYRVYETPGDESLSVVGVNGFEITELVPDLRVTSISKSGTEITMTWLSLPGETYDIKAGPDLLGFPALAADNVPSQGATTTHVFTLPVALIGEPKVFFVVEQNP